MPYTRPANSVRDSSRIENAAALLSELKAIGITVERKRRNKAWKLVVRGPVGALTQDVLSRIQVNAAPIRDHLLSLEAREQADRQWLADRGLPVPDRTDVAEAGSSPPKVEVVI